MSWSGKERRSSQRFPISVKVELSSEQTQSSLKSGFYYTLDLSRQGLFMLCEPPLPLGTMLQITVALPGVRPLLPVAGKVVRQMQEPRPGVGVEFVNVPDEFQMLLDEYLQQLPSR